MEYEKESDSVDLQNAKKEALIAAMEKTFIIKNNGFDPIDNEKFILMNNAALKKAHMKEYKDKVSKEYKDKKLNKYLEENDDDFNPFADTDIKKKEELGKPIFIDSVLIKDMDIIDGNEALVPTIPYLDSSQKKLSFFKVLGEKVGRFFGFGEAYKQRRELDATVESLISNGMLFKVIELQQQGYQLRDKLKNSFSGKMIETINNSPLSLFENILRKGWKIEDDYLLLFSFTEHGVSVLPQNTIGTTKYPLISALMQEKLADKEFKNKLFTTWKTALNELANTKPWSIVFQSDIEKFEKRYEVVKNGNNYAFTGVVFTEVSLPDYLACMDDLNKIVTKCQKLKSVLKEKNQSINKHGQKYVQFSYTLKTLAESMAEKMDDRYSKDFSKLESSLPKVENQGTTNEINKINPVTGENSQTLKIEDLPSSAQKLIAQINNHYENTQQNIQRVSESEALDIQNMTQKRVPEILHKYLNIDEEYRHTLFNVQGKNAETLMIESLENIEHILDNVVKNINQSKIQDLSVTQRYTKDVRNGYTESQILDNSLENKTVINDSPVMVKPREHPKKIKI